MLHSPPWSVRTPNLLSTWLLSDHTQSSRRWHHSSNHSPYACCNDYLIVHVPAYSQTVSHLTQTMFHTPKVVASGLVVCNKSQFYVCDFVSVPTSFIWSTWVHVLSQCVWGRWEGQSFLNWEIYNCRFFGSSKLMCLSSSPLLRWLPMSELWSARDPSPEFAWWV
jgi:hypothetical protein